MSCFCFYKLQNSHCSSERDIHLLVIKELCEVLSFNLKLLICNAQRNKKELVKLWNKISKALRNP